MGDLLMEFSPPHQTNELLFRMATACFAAAAENPHDLQSILRYFEVWLLKIEGFLPDLRRCAECHRSFDNDEAVYVATTDFVLCCRTCGGPSMRSISKGLHAHLQTMQTLPPSRFGVEARNIPSQTKRELAELTHQLIGRILERLPRVRPTFA
jgi:DNA repair protein RecO (recombination protein O)